MAWLGFTGFHCVAGALIRRSGWWRPADESSRNLPLPALRRRRTGAVAGWRTGCSAVSTPEPGVGGAGRRAADLRRGLGRLLGPAAPVHRSRGRRARRGDEAGAGPAEPALAPGRHCPGAARPGRGDRARPAPAGAERGPAVAVLGWAGRGAVRAGGRGGGVGGAGAAHRAGHAVARLAGAGARGRTPRRGARPRGSPTTAPIPLLVAARGAGRSRGRGQPDWLARRSGCRWWSSRWAATWSGWSGCGARIGRAYVVRGDRGAGGAAGRRLSDQPVVGAGRRWPRRSFWWPSG